MKKIQIARRRFLTLLEETIYYDIDDWEEPYLDGVSLSPDTGAIDGDIDARMQTSESGISYYNILPAGTKRCKVFTQFYKLKPGSKTWKQENVILKEGMYFLIYSPISKVYFLRQVHEHFDVEKVKQYIRDKNLYLIEQ